MHASQQILAETCVPLTLTLTLEQLLGQRRLLWSLVGQAYLSLLGT